MRAQYPRWGDLAEEEPEVIAKLIGSAGLARRKTELIQSCLKAIHAERGEYAIDFLADLTPEAAMSWLQTLPGVGPKTAALVLCFRFGMPVLPVDVHVHRVSLRIGLIPPKTDANRAHKILGDWVPGRLVRSFHLALIQHGRGLCQARRPRCEVCPLQVDCAFAAQGAA
jgi:endonuclease-3